MRQDRGTFVEAVNDQEYSIKMTNNSSMPLVVRAFIDGEGGRR